MLGAGGTASPAGRQPDLFFSVPPCTRPADEERPPGCSRSAPPGRSCRSPRGCGREHLLHRRHGCVRGKRVSGYAGDRFLPWREEGVPRLM